MTDLLLALLILGATLVSWVAWRAVERESAGTPAATPASPFTLGLALQGVALVAGLPLFAWLARFGKAGPADPESASRWAWTASFLWFWLRAGGFAQLLLTVPAALREDDASARRRLLLWAKLPAALSGAFLFVDLSRAGRGAALPTAAGLTAGLCVLYAVWLALRLAGRLR